jgi:hypothetical protein
VKPTKQLAQKTVNTRIGKLEFKNGYPSKDTVAKLYDEADLNRAVAAYRFFYPNVSVAGLFKGLEPFAPVDNKSFFIMESTPKQVLFTPNSDTPYAAIPLDLRAGPITVELPPGPLLGVANDMNFRWVIDMGLPGLIASGNVFSWSPERLSFLS